MLGSHNKEEFLQQLDQSLTGWRDPALHIRESLKNGDFELFAQPILTLQTDRYEMAEVLVRLGEEEKSLLPPGDFLPVFEHYGLMHELDRWVTSQVIRHVAQGSRVQRFSINLSRQTLGDDDFPPLLLDELKSTGVPASALQFEVDETDMLQLPQETEVFASMMKAIGCGLVIDGFGRRSTTFAPLTILLPQFVKVDSSIIRKLLNDPVAERKIQGILRAAKAIAFGTVAECVEDQDILTRLKALGVDCAQGFGIVQPHSIEKLCLAPSGSETAETRT